MPIGLSAGKLIDRPDAGKFAFLRALRENGDSDSWPPVGIPYVPTGLGPVLTGRVSRKSVGRSQRPFRLSWRGLKVADTRLTSGAWTRPRMSVEPLLPSLPRWLASLSVTSRTELSVHSRTDHLSSLILLRSWRHPSAKLASARYQAGIILVPRLHHPLIQVASSPYPGCIISLPGLHRLVTQVASSRHEGSTILFRGRHHLLTKAGSSCSEASVFSFRRGYHRRKFRPSPQPTRRMVTFPSDWPRHCSCTSYPRKIECSMMPQEYWRVPPAPSNFILH